MSKKTIANGLLLLTAIIWGTAFAFQKQGVETIEPLTFGAARCTLSAAAVGLVAFLLERGKERSREYRMNTIKGGLICGIFLTIATNLQQIGLVYTTAGKAAFITAMYMVLIPVISFFILRRRIGLQAWIAVALAVAGLYLLCINGDFSIGRGDIFVIACALSFAVQMLFVDRYSPKASPVGISAVQFIFNAAVTWILALIFESPSLPSLMEVKSDILYCGVVSGGVGYTLQIVGQKDTDPTTAGLLLSLESVFGALAGMLLLREAMSMREALGAAIMFIAIIMVQIPLRKKEGN